MRQVIAVASGKGGTGKTTVALGLAQACVRRGLSTWLIDADVEAPNCHLFLPAESQATTDVNVAVPELDTAKCDACHACVKACEYHALVATPTGALVLPELCHSCGACLVVCPRDALSETERVIGTVTTAVVEGLQCVTGRLNIGEPQAVPVIDALRAALPSDGVIIIDAPPGTSCPFVAAVGVANYVVLVAEPTPFGLHDLELACTALRELDLPTGVIVNRADIGDDRVQRFAQEHRLALLTTFPHDDALARAQSVGHSAGTLPAWAARFDALATQLLAEVPACVS